MSNRSSLRARAYRATGGGHQGTCHRQTGPAGGGAGTGHCVRPSVVGPRPFQRGGPVRELASDADMIEGGTVPSMPAGVVEAARYRRRRCCPRGLAVEEGS